MSQLLTERLSVVGQGQLRLAFSSALIFVLKGIRGISAEEREGCIAQIEAFAETPAANFVFRTLHFEAANIALWTQCLTGEVYAFNKFEQQLQKEMQPLLENAKTRLESIWQVYAGIYARALLQTGSRTLLTPKHGFNQETVQYFINHPEQVHGEELINGIPPLLEKGYIYLNLCGEDQCTEWHRNTFMDSYFKALTSYKNILSEPEIRRAFKVKIS